MLPWNVLWFVTEICNRKPKIVQKINSNRNQKKSKSVSCSKKKLSTAVTAVLSAYTKQGYEFWLWCSSKQ